MGVGISCKYGLNMHIGEMLTNYAANKFESRSKQKNLDVNRSQSESSLFTIVSTKSGQSTTSDQFDLRKRCRDKQLDEHAASQVIYLLLPNNENLFIEKLNCDLCIQQFMDEDGAIKYENDQMLIQTKVDKILTESSADNKDKIENNSLKTLQSMRLNSSGLAELDNQDLSFIDDNIEKEEDEISYETTKRLSSIEEENYHDSEHSNEQEKNNEQSNKAEIIETNQLTDRLSTTKSSVKVQMNTLSVPSLAFSNKLKKYPDKLADKLSDKLTDKLTDKLKEKRLETKNSKLKQSLRFSTFDSQDLNEDSDDQLKAIGIEEKKQMLKEMIEIAKFEKLKQNKCYPFYESINDEFSTYELIRPFSADYARDLTDQTLDYMESKFIKLNKLKNKRLTYFSDPDLSKWKDTNQFDNKSITTTKTELLQLDSLDKMLADRDQLESVTLDSLDDNDECATSKPDKYRQFNENIKSKFSFKFGLADSIRLNERTKRDNFRIVTKTKRKEYLNKCSLVNSWLIREEFDQDEFYIQEFSQFNSKFNEELNQQFDKSFNQSFNQQFNLQFNPNIDQSDCIVDDCNLCRLNEDKIKELDSDVFQLMHVLHALDEILQEKERHLQLLAEKVESSPLHLIKSNTNRHKKLIRSRENLKRKVNMLKKRSSRLGISMCKNEQGKQLIIFKDEKSTYHIEIGDSKSDCK